MNNIFGWDYPPGCNSVPGDDDTPCEVCGNYDDRCICPECPECGDVGNPECYVNHGLTKTPAQIESLSANQAAWQAADLTEIEMYERQLQNGVDETFWNEQE